MCGLKNIKISEVQVPDNTLITSKHSHFLLLLLFVLLTARNLLADEAERVSEADSFYFDAVAFNSTKGGRADLFFIVPYKNLKFLNADGQYIAKYLVEITVFDTKANLITSKSIDRVVKEDDYFTSQGGKGNYSTLMTSVNLKSGEYKIVVKISDSFSSQVFEKYKTIAVVDFSAYSFSMSGIMLLSEIEEQDGKFKITPNVSDNISPLKNGFFIFFESYLYPKLEEIVDDKKTVDYFIKVFDDKNNEVRSFPKFTKTINLKDNETISNNLVTEQYYQRIEGLENLQEGTYVLRLLATKGGGESQEYDERNLIAVTERALKLQKSDKLKIYDNLDLAIRQLRYVAKQSDIDKIQAGKDDKEKYLLFQDFWISLDPSSGTEKNEAMEEYYQRIRYTNENFKAYLEGWLSDKGQVYIVLGQPNYIEKSRDDGRRVSYERWVYGSREFVFADNNGFGDYRLIRPYGFNDKYVYKP